MNSGMSPSGKAPDFDSGIRRFKSGHPSQQKSLICLPDKLGFFELSVPQAEREVPFGREVCFACEACFAR